MDIFVKDIVKILDTFAPKGLAMKWDNVGLQLGSPEWKVKKVLLSLDVTPNAIDKAIATGCSMIVAHHPMIFKPVKSLTNPLHLKLIENRIAVYCAHTNLDTIQGGVNTKLAETLGLKNIRFLSHETGAEWKYVKVFVPHDNVEEMIVELGKVGAGIIGNYNNCFNYHNVAGRFTPNEYANPSVGNVTTDNIIDEVELQFYVDSFYLPKVIKAIHKYHPYETPSFVVLNAERENSAYGLGVIADLEEPMKLDKFAKHVKTALKAPSVKCWPGKYSFKKEIKTVALCGGSGSSVLRKALGVADVFVSGDFTYHTVLDSRMPLIDAGHIYTENPILDVLQEKLAVLDIKFDRLTSDEHEISKLKVL
jgi:dinuclear metal center YbgI/SA1388 family protein